MCLFPPSSFIFSLFIPSCEPPAATTGCGCPTFAAALSRLKRFSDLCGLSGIVQGGFYFHPSNKVGAGVPSRVGASRGTPERKNHLAAVVSDHSPEASPTACSGTTLPAHRKPTAPRPPAPAGAPPALPAAQTWAPPASPSASAPPSAACSSHAESPAPLSAAASACRCPAGRASRA